MNENKISIKGYEQAADLSVSLGGIKWEKKWDVCVQCDSREEAEALRTALTRHEPAECDGGQCGIGGYCKQCPKTQSEQEPVAWKMKGVPAFATSRPNDTDSIKWDALYATPPQRQWVGLTDKEIEDCLEMSIHGTCRAIEQALREKNT